MTKKEIKNCANYSTAKKIVEWWNRPDSDFINPEIDKDNQILGYRVGTARWRVIKRAFYKKNDVIQKEH